MGVLEGALESLGVVGTLLTILVARSPESLMEEVHVHYTSWVLVEKQDLHRSQVDVEILPTILVDVLAQVQEVCLVHRY